MKADYTNKRIITVATTGAWPTKEHNPNLPLTPEEVAEEVYRCWKAGAAIAHIHVRDEEGRPTMRFDRFEETVRLIRAHEDCDIVINLTTAGAPNVPDEDRIRHLYELHPDMASFDCGSLNMQHAFIADNAPAFLEKLGYAMQEANVKTEIEVFDIGMIHDAIYYLKKGVLKAPPHFQLVMGATGGIPATVENLCIMLRNLPEGATWGAFGVGRQSVPIMLAAMALGGHIRVGMEDNVMLEKGVLATSNAQFVERAKKMLESAGLQAATPAEAREILGIG